MRSKLFRLIPVALASLGLAPAAAQDCGGPFPAFLDGLRAEARAQGIDGEVADSFLRGARLDERVLRADRSQGIFRAEFTDFARRLISADRLANGQRNYQRYRAVFDRAEREHGVPPGILLAFWAFETDFGGFQGDYNTRDALVTLAHDCRRPELFRPQVLAAMVLHGRGQFDPATTTGAWAGEIGQVQMLPADILERAVDGDGDGRVDLKRSAPDALLSGANMLQGLGWRAGEPWLQEVVVPDTLDWSRTGLRTELSVAEWERLGVRARSGSLPAGRMASVLVPQGRDGPAFMVFPNFRVLFEWNQSFVYVLTTAYFATRLEGAPVFDPRDPEPGLSPEQMRELQRRLTARGHDTGGVTGILGARTRAAVQDAQRDLGLPADAWPTPALLSRL
jgi:lytic murein transglycosylase